MSWLKDLLHGCAFGVANIIPGVSGGTLALVLGFYERLIQFLNRLNLQTFRELLQLKLSWLKQPRNPSRRQAFFHRLQEDDWPFMGRILLGALIAILGLAAFMDYMLNQHFSITYGFFFGLILLSIHVPWVHIANKSPSVWICLLVGILITVGTAAGVNPAEQAQRKSDLYRTQTEVQAAQPEDPTGPLSFTGKYTPQEYGMIFLAGMIAISAMVLPGISGSLLMILLGQYFLLIRAISSLLADRLLDDLLFLGICSAGMVIGILVTARLVDAALRKAPDATMGFLTGLIIGSLYALWPFKELLILDEVQRDGTVLEGRLIASNINLLPSDPGSWIPVLTAMVLGAGLMGLVMKLENKTS
jgi:putative membrane protein